MNSVKKKSKKPVIAGIVIPAQWDANGKVITVTIHTNDEKVFLVEHTKIGNDLLNLYNLFPMSTAEFVKTLPLVL